MMNAHDTPTHTDNEDYHSAKKVKTQPPQTETAAQLASAIFPHYLMGPVVKFVDNKTLKKAKASSTKTKKKTDSR